MKDFHNIAREIADIVEQKQLAYGDSFSKAPQILKILYPDGIELEDYENALLLVRILDKINRIATNREDLMDESPFADILGYCLLALNKKEEQIEDAKRRTEKANRFYRNYSDPSTIKKWKNKPPDILGDSGNLPSE